MKEFDLEKRTFIFAQSVRKFCSKLQKTLIATDDIRQLIRSSGSVGANYIEANDPLGKKDFLMRIRICRKEAKESVYWLQLLEVPMELSGLQKELIQEGTELLKIFSTIVSKNV